jgi:hypothetical protein
VGAVNRIVLITVGIWAIVNLLPAGPDRAAIERSNPLSKPSEPAEIAEPKRIGPHILRPGSVGMNGLGPARPPRDLGRAGWASSEWDRQKGAAATCVELRHQAFAAGDGHSA